MVLTSSQTINGTVVPAGTYIKSAYIHDGSIDSAKIGKAQVDTLQIAGEAVIVPRLQYTPNTEVFNGNGVFVLNSVTINSMGGAIAIEISVFTLRASAKGLTPNTVQYLQVKRNDTVLREFSFGNTGLSQEVIDATFKNNPDATYSSLLTTGAFPTILDAPPSGNNIYSLVLRVTGSNNGFKSEISERSLYLMGAKR